MHTFYNTTLALNFGYKEALYSHFLLDPELISLSAWVNQNIPRCCYKSYFSTALSITPKKDYLVLNIWKSLGLELSVSETPWFTVTKIISSFFICLSQTIIMSRECTFPSLA